MGFFKRIYLFDFNFLVCFLLSWLSRRIRIIGGVRVNVEVSYKRLFYLKSKVLSWMW